jgi:hypothetical protein
MSESERVVGRGCVADGIRMPPVAVPGIVSKEGDSQISVCCQESSHFHHRVPGNVGFNPDENENFSTAGTVHSLQSLQYFPSIHLSPVPIRYWYWS